jgi:hypothetical protein
MTHEQRLDRLEGVVHVLAEDQLALQKLIAQLATETRVGFDRVARQFEETDRYVKEMWRETDERFRETDRRMQEMNQRVAERSQKTDERIENLVSAIGKLIHQDRPRES